MYALVIALSLAPSELGSLPVVDLTEYVPVLISLDRSPAFKGANGRSHMIDVVWSELKKGTRVEPRLYEPLAVDTCPFYPLGEGERLCPVHQALEAEDGILALYVIANVEEQKSTLQLGWVELEALQDEWLRTVQALSTMRTLDEKIAEARTLSETLSVATHWGQERAVSDELSLRKALRASFEEDFVSLLSRYSLQTGAEVEFDIYPRGAHLMIDELSFGSAPGVFRVRGLDSGVHRAKIFQEDYVSETRDIVVPARGQLNQRVELMPSHHRAWDRMYMAGGVLGVLSIGAGMYGLIEAKNRPAPRHSQPMIRFIYEPEIQPSSSAVGEGPLVLGTSAGLAVSATAFFVLGHVRRDESRVPWLETLISLGAGLATYGAIELIEAAR